MGHAMHEPSLLCRTHQGFEQTPLQDCNQNATMKNGEFIVEHWKAGSYFRHLNNIQNQAHCLPVLFKMNGYCHKSLVIGRSPGVSSKIQAAFIVLATCEHICSFYCFSLLTCIILAIRFRTFANTSLTSRDTVDGDGM
jgi:hypothetical protein